jgi:hypothetical protein
VNSITKLSVAPRTLPASLAFGILLVPLLMSDILTVPMTVLCSVVAWIVAILWALWPHIRHPGGARSLGVLPVLGTVVGISALGLVLGFLLTGATLGIEKVLRSEDFG